MGARDWLDLFRPFTLWPVLLIALVYALVGLGRSPDAGEWLRILLAGGLLVIANGGSNALGSVGDVVEDSAHPTKRDRPFASGRLSVQEVVSSSICLWLIAVGLSAVFLPVTFTVLYVAILLFAVVYSFPPVRAKKHLGLGNAVIATPRGGLGIAAAFTLYGSIWSPHLWVIMALFVPYVYLANSSKDISDVEADAGAGVRNFATVWGTDVCREITATGFVWLVGGTLLLGLWRGDPFMFAVAPLAALGLYASVRWDGPRLWALFYMVYGVVTLLVGLPALLAL